MQDHLKLRIKYSVLALFKLILFFNSSIVIVEASEAQNLETTTKSKVKKVLSPLLSQYCQDSCKIVDISVEAGEHVPEVTELGFEGITQNKAKRSFYIKHILVDIQIEKLMSSINRNRLSIILKNHLKPIGGDIEVNWIPIDVPQLGHSLSLLEILKDKIRSKISRAVNKIFRKYCPDSCILSNISIEGELLTPEETSGVDPRRIVKSNTSHTVLRISEVNATVTFSDKLQESDRFQIQNILEARTKFVSPISFEAIVTSFPETFASKQDRLNSESNDPYGLEKLRQTLTLFKELAGTKEIISTKESNSASNSNNNSNSEYKADSKTSEQSTNKTEAETSQLSESNSFGDDNNLAYIIGIIAISGILIVVMLKVSQANQEAKMLVNAKNNNANEIQEEASKKSLAIQKPQSNTEDMQDLLKIQELKEELTKIFINAPKVSKETFTRILHDEGVEEAAKYVHIFGKMIVFELLSDPAMQRSLYELSEYYHKSNLEFSTKEELALLINLKTKVVAQEIKVLAANTIDQFEFLQKLDTNQIFTLISDESTQVKSIVLTQLSPKRRRTIFAMFEGGARISLMSELCKADAIPKEYLQNVALALSKKVLAKPELDTQSLRSSDIILELLEKSQLNEQKVLMNNLRESNPDSYRAIKMKLVTIHMLPYLKDGHLLEIVMGLERDHLLTFLAGCTSETKQLLMSHAPEELAESWAEDLETIAGLDESQYILVEMMVLSKIRQLSANGAINILDINEIIFGKSDSDHLSPKKNEQSLVSRRNLVA